MLRRLPPRWLYQRFPFVQRVSAWGETRLTAVGRLLAGLSFAGMLFGLDLRQTLAHVLALGGAGLLGAALLLGARWRAPLRVRRCLPELVSADAPFTYYLEITNVGRRIERDLLVQDCLATPVLDHATFTQRRGLVEGEENRFDRALGFVAWRALRARERGATLPLLTLPAIAPGSTVRVAVETTALRRGWLRFTGLLLLRPEPLGLARARARLARDDALLALPRRHPVPALHFVAHRHYQRGGVSLAHAVGDAQEFAGVRDYRPGDPQRHIHWRSFARTGRPIVKEFRDEYFDRHALVVDTHLDLADWVHFEAVITVATSIALSPRPHDAILDLVFAGARVIEVGAGRGLGDTVQLARWLAEARPSGAAGFDALTALLRQRGDELASVVLVLARHDATRRALVDALRARRMDVLCLWVEAPAGADLAAPRPGHVLRPDHLAADLAAVRFAT